MKNNYLKRIWLLIPALILAALITAVFSSSKAYAGTVRLSHSTLNMYTKGGRKTIQLQLLDDGKPVSAVWWSSKKKIASVSASGYVKARRQGKAKIHASYGGITYSCYVTVKKTSKNYKKCIKAYNRFLMNPYVIYTEGGKKDQADFFCTVDLDKNGIPELLVNVVDPNGGRYYVLYRFSKGRMSTGQIMGSCSDFLWYSSRAIVSFIRYESNQTLFIHSKDNGISLNTVAIERRHNNKTTYYMSDGSIGTYGVKMSAVEFGNYVDHDLLGYTTPKPLNLRLNTPSNRARYLK